jgi:hypothetical protein
MVGALLPWNAIPTTTSHATKLTAISSPRSRLNATFDGYIQRQMELSAGFSMIALLLKKSAPAENSTDS